MLHLQWLDLSYNLITNLEVDSFRNSRRLQVVYLSQNQIGDIPQDLFRANLELRIVSLSNNNLKYLPDGLFANQGIEALVELNNIYFIYISLLTILFISDSMYLIIHLPRFQSCL